MVPLRNDKVIFEDIKYVFGINMILNGLWLVLFQQNSGGYFIVAAIEIFCLLASCLYLMVKSQAVEEWWDYLILTFGFSIYAGWVTSASILNVCFVLKTYGMDKNEQEWGVAILWVAFVIYNAAAIR